MLGRRVGPRHAGPVTQSVRDGKAQWSPLADQGGRPFERVDETARRCRRSPQPTRSPGLALASSIPDQ
jgi:hypothetical protein